MIVWMNPAEHSLIDSDADVLVNPVNTMGIPGKGLALAFSKAYPAETEQYKEACRAKTYRGGDCFLAKRNGPWIAFVMTKDKWWEPSRPAWIEDGIRNLLEELDKIDFKTVAVPALGAGLGGLPLEWSARKINDGLRDRPEEFRVYISPESLGSWHYPPVHASRERRTGKDVPTKIGATSKS